MESRENVRALVRAMRAENSAKSACYARTDAPPEFGGRGLKRSDLPFVKRMYGDAPPECGGRGLKLRRQRFRLSERLDASPEFTVGENYG